MKSIIYNKVPYYHFVCLSDFAGNNHQPGFWSDMWVLEDKDWYEIENAIVKEVDAACRFPDGRLNRKMNYYALLKERLDAHILQKIKDVGSYVITLGGGWEYYVDDEAAKAFRALPHWRFENNKELLLALMEDSVDIVKMFKAIGINATINPTI